MDELIIKPFALNKTYDFYEIYFTYSQLFKNIDEYLVFLVLLVVQLRDRFLDRS